MLCLLPGDFTVLHNILRLFKEEEGLMMLIAKHIIFFSSGIRYESERRSVLSLLFPFHFIFEGLDFFFFLTMHHLF